MNPLDKLLENWKRFREQNPDIDEAIKEGYEIGAYDEETGLIIAVELVEGNLKIKVIGDSHFIPKQEEVTQ